MFLNHAQKMLLVAAASLLLMQGCATSAEKSLGMRQSLMQGRPDLALTTVEQNGETSDVMTNMNRGLLRRMNRDYAGSNEVLEAAKKEIEALYGVSVTEQAGAVIANDEAISFKGDRYEQVLVHAYMALNYISLGQIDAARVEMLQADVKMMEWGETPEEDPFARYLTGIVFEALGEADDARVAYSKAVDVYKKTKSRHGLNIPSQLKSDLLFSLSKTGMNDELQRYKKEFGMNGYKAPATKGMGELIVLMHNGLAPQRDQTGIQIFSPELAGNIRIAIPTYPNPPAYVNQIRLQVSGQQKVLEPVENIDGLARAALEGDIAGISARALARAVVKKKMEKEAGDRGGGLMQLAMLVVNTASEIADTRCWNTLPQEIQLGRVYLPEGTHQVKMDVIGQTGAVVDTYEMPVVIKANRKTIISEHWVAPRPLITAPAESENATTTAANDTH
ncbi:MAG: hypothetical protein QG652_172 [Pseudomonadota bacterium]|nr:hypothetical protein [Pseudomonadota bacterium]